jgi:hypothetical protein
MLERCAYGILFAVTCGIYGWFFHTRLLARRVEAEFSAMREGLAAIVDIIPGAEDGRCQMAPVDEAAEQSLPRANVSPIAAIARHCGSRQIGLIVDGADGAYPRRLEAPRRDWAVTRVRPPSTTWSVISALCEGAARPRDSSSHNLTHQ